MRKNHDVYKDIFRMWGILASMFIVLVVLTASTYAWFTTNRIVSTDKVTARSGTDSLELQISPAGGTAFKASNEASIRQVNQTSVTRLMPVSTADLKTFVYNSRSEGNIASAFVPVEKEEYYYHGRFYIRASAQGQTAGSRVALYLDEDNEVGGSLAQSEEGMLLNAARLGLTFDQKNPVIFFLSDSHNGTEQQARNTKLNGTILEDGQVLRLSEGKLTGVKDPAVALADRTIILEEDRVLFPQASLLEMELNKIYTVDVYLYLEGCDPDCSDSVSMNEADMHLAFYGVLKE